MAGCKIITINIDRKRLDLIDLMVDQGFAPSRSELIRRFINSGIITLIKQENDVNQLLGLDQSIIADDTVTEQKRKYRVETEVTTVEVNGITYQIPKAEMF